MKKTIVILFVMLVVLAALNIAAPFIFMRIADFLIVGDNLENADIILTLAGDSNGERVEQAVKLYKDKWAPKILMSGGPAVWNLTYAQNMRNQAVSLGVPKKDVLIQDRSESTYEDIKYSFLIIKKLNAKKVIIVTSPFHMRRAVMTAKKMYGRQGIKVIAFPVQKAKWVAKGWWKRHEDTQPVIYEYMAMAQYLLKGWLL